MTPEEQVPGAPAGDAEQPVTGGGISPPPGGAEEAGLEELAAEAEELAGEVADDVEEVLVTLAKVVEERDELRDTAQRLKADLDNLRKRVERERLEQAERAAEALVRELLPVLDACDAAIAHGADDVAPIRNSLVGTLGKAGLEPVPGEGEPFDPHVHEAVLHEEGDGGPAVVAEVMRAGYRWNQRVLRPAMVRVRG